MSPLAGDWDKTWAANELEEFQRKYQIYRDDAVYQQLSQDGYFSLDVSDEDENVSKSDLVAAENILDLILVRVFPEWEPPSGTEEVIWSFYSAAATRAIPLLRRDEELRLRLGSGAPRLDASRLHPWVWEAARSQWESGYFRQAVAAASRKINSEAQKKYGTRELSETNLFNQAFSKDEPGPDRPRFRLPEDDGYKTALGVREGLRSFAAGCYAAIRNPAAHDDLDELDEVEALEQLAAFSLLARWVDRSEVRSLPVE